MSVGAPGQSWRENWLKGNRNKQDYKEPKKKDRNLKDWLNKKYEKYEVKEYESI